MARPASSENTVSLPDSAVCTTCSIHRLNRAPQPVEAMSHFGSKDYYFCSEECKQQFDNNPEFFIELPLPRLAPAFVLSSLTGGYDSLANYIGKPVLLDFWASWCAPCARSMRDLEKLFHEFRSDSLVVLGITLDSLGNPKVSGHVRNNTITYPILFDNRAQPTWLAYGVKSIPSLYLIDRRGDIVRQWRGAPDSNEVSAAVRSFLLEPDKK